MARTKNATTYGGNEPKDPLAGEYNVEAKPVDTEAVGEVKVESKALVKIPLNWSKHYYIVYSNGETLEYGVGRNPTHPVGAKPLYYLMEVLD